MSAIYTPGDNVGDVLHRAAAVVAFISESLTEGRKPGEHLTLSDDALHGLNLITQDLRCSLCHAAQSA